MSAAEKVIACMFKKFKKVMESQQSFLMIASTESHIIYTVALILAIYKE